VKADKLLILEDLKFYAKGFIFNKEYCNEQYLKLYQTLLNINNNDDDEAYDEYVNILYGTKMYNKSNYEKLILDMCMEFLFQMSTDKYKTYNYDRDYLLYLIKYADVNCILDVISNNDISMDVLASHYADYNLFDNKLRKQKDINNMKPEIQSVIKKLRKGKVN
jgi:hypothetical protein